MHKAIMILTTAPVSYDYWTAIEVTQVNGHRLVAVIPMEGDDVLHLATYQADRY